MSDFHPHCLLCGLAVLVVGNLHPLTARPSSHFTLAPVAVSVTGAHHLLWGLAVNNWNGVGTTLPSSGQLVGQLGMEDRSVHFPECASWTPALQVACKREGGGQNFMVQRVKQGLHDGKDRKMHLLQFTEVPVGDTVIPTHWPSLQEIFSQRLFKVLPHLSQATHAAASFDLIEALFQRHLVLFFHSFH